MGGAPLRTKSSFDPATAPRPVLIGVPQVQQAPPTVVVQTAYAVPQPYPGAPYAPGANFTPSPYPTDMKTSIPGPMNAAYPGGPAMVVEVVAMPQVAQAPNLQQLVAAGQAPPPGLINHAPNMQTQQYQQPTLEQQQMLAAHNAQSMEAVMFNRIDNLRMP